MQKYHISNGSAIPLGATVVPGGINFALFATDCETLTLCIHGEDRTKRHELNLDPGKNRTGNIWHIRISGLTAPVTYYYRARNIHGKLLELTDPYSRILAGKEKWGSASRQNASVLDSTEFDWKNDKFPMIPLQDSIMYELHTRGFTAHSSSDTRSPGTFSALTEKIPYLKELGITSVELLPVTEFNETEYTRTSPSGKNLVNFWGYDPISFFAVKAGYAAGQVPGSAINEFKTMVREFHKSGIEVILDVVFNHTGEGDGEAYYHNLRGLAATTYYMTDRDRSKLLNFTGCGNTVNTNHPVTGDLIVAALRYWVTEMHVDGFRFDLASILCRGEDGRPLDYPPIIERITKDPVLAQSKLIAEAWDAAGLYQVGSFPAFGRWAEWNGKFRDDLRRYIKGDPGLAPAVATRIAGNADLYRSNSRRPFHSINFITCHDGFTMADLVSYNHKHNVENGEKNRDGTEQNFSWNCGTEGPTREARINKLRLRQIKNFFAMLLTAQGVPMLLAGDEFGRTQQGNNNAYCQDNDISWVNWELAKTNAELLRFVSLMIRFRKAHQILRRTTFFEDDPAGKTGIHWHGGQLFKPDWSARSTQLAFHMLPYKTDEHDIFIISNTSNRKTRFEIPAPFNGFRWHLTCDTAIPTPRDIYKPGQEKECNKKDEYIAAPHSTVILISK